jgi:hypothetical protein
LKLLMLKLLSNNKLVFYLRKLRLWMSQFLLIASMMQTLDGIYSWAPHCWTVMKLQSMSNHTTSWRVIWASKATNTTINLDLSRVRALWSQASALLPFRLVEYSFWHLWSLESATARIVNPLQWIGTQQFDLS